MYNYVGDPEPYAVEMDKDIKRAGLNYSISVIVQIKLSDSKDTELGKGQESEIIYG
ncbi:unnamed protein product [Paramecium sonneborni]|uniref:Uncharacterized protein n=1 Tax=Paramecium sonneborni TaxID=65129 RepID=A0A8S1Q906_9CILI|nr:unnamed protein product [Paramecium sonneborni]